MLKIHFHLNMFLYSISVIDEFLKRRRKVHSIRIQIEFSSICTSFGESQDRSDWYASKLKTYRPAVRSIASMTVKLYDNYKRRVYLLIEWFMKANHKWLVILWYKLKIHWIRIMLWNEGCNCCKLAWLYHFRIHQICSNILLLRYFFEYIRLWWQCQHVSCILYCKRDFGHKERCSVTSVDKCHTRAQWLSAKWNAIREHRLKFIS